MCHRSSFLLPPPPQNENSTSSVATTNYALVILNQNLPRFAPLLWDHGSTYSLLSSSVVVSFVLVDCVCVSFWGVQRSCECAQMEAPIGSSMKCLFSCLLNKPLLFNPGSLFFFFLRIFFCLHVSWLFNSEKGIQIQNKNCNF